MTHFFARVGEALVRAIMLGLLMVGGILLGPVILCWWVYGALKRRPHHVEPEYAIVE
jgi:hypothetical protein